MNLPGTHALVTGGGSGIGLAIAQALAGAGARVTIAGRRAGTLAAAAQATPGLHPCEMDVTSPESVQAGFDAACAARGPVQVCVANAGIAVGGRFAQVSPAQWRETMATNLDGAFHTVQAALAARDPGQPARVIAVSSIAGLRGLKGAVAYTPSKHGLVGLIRALSEEYMGQNVTFNALCPGYVDTAIVHNQIPGLMRRLNTDAAGARAFIAAGNRHQRLLDAGEVAGAALWLCTAAARSVNGQTIEISGGQV